MDENKQIIQQTANTVSYTLLLPEPCEFKNFLSGPV